MTEITRREFIKGAAVTTAAVAGASALAGCSPAPAPAPGIPEKWDKEADVVVVGYGGAGAAAAITAHDVGVEVIMLEKNPEGKEGGNTRVSGNLVLAPLPEHETMFAEYLMGADYWDQVPDEVFKAAAAEYVKNDEWLTGLGCALGAFPFEAEVLVPGGESVRCVINGGTFGREGVWKVVAENVEDREIDILYETPGKRLVQACNGEIIGIIAESGGQEIAIKAKRAVILTTGGYEFNEQMQKDYAPAYPIKYFGNPANTGDGVIMAAAVGADLWHMNNVMGALLGGIKVPEHESPLFSTFGMIGALITGAPVYGFVFVDKFGKRFMDEMKDSRHGWGWRELLYFNAEEMTYPMIPWYSIFDETTRLQGPLSSSFAGWAGIVEGMEWSADNSVEIEKGYILKADSLKELGEKIMAQEANEGKMDPATLEETLARYNEYCDQGNDPDFNRPGVSLQAINTPPFYAIETWGTSVNTQGGPRRDEQGRIIDVFGKPIPRLYSAGELGSIWASLYQGSGNVGECFAFGRISGRNAAAEEPWE
ncbi:MAG: FAD-binding protein [Chloroflexota bacterium]|nr:FAD-binding protein [Chloroflexota bacterium]